MEVSNKAGFLMGVYELVFDSATPFRDCDPENCGSFPTWDAPGMGIGCGFYSRGKCLEGDPVTEFLEDNGYVNSMYISGDFDSAALLTFYPLSDRDRGELSSVAGVSKVYSAESDSR